MTEKRILLVEDDELVSQLLAHTLRGEGYRVDVAGTVAAAWRYLDAQSYTVIIADWQLPDGDGTVIAAAGSELGAATFVMSGHLFRMPGGRAEAHETLMKPVRPSEILDAVERRIGKAA